LRSSGALCLSIFSVVTIKTAMTIFSQIGLQEEHEYGIMG
jgi:hypothetical protein